MTQQEIEQILNHLKEVHERDYKTEQEPVNLDGYKIKKGHTLEEYFDKYGTLLEKGDICAYTNKETWLLKKNVIYWEINCNYDFVYFEIPNTFKLPFLHLTYFQKSLTVMTAYVLALTGTGIGIYFGVKNNNKTPADPDKPVYKLTISEEILVKGELYDDWENKLVGFSDSNEDLINYVDIQSGNVYNFNVFFYDYGALEEEELIGTLSGFMCNGNDLNITTNAYLLKYSEKNPLDLTYDNGVLHFELDLTNITLDDNVVLTGYTRIEE